MFSPSFELTSAANVLYAARSRWGNECSRRHQNIYFAASVLAADVNLSIPAAVACHAVASFLATTVFRIATSVLAATVISELPRVSALLYQPSCCECSRSRISELPLVFSLPCSYITARTVTLLLDRITREVSGPALAANHPHIGNRQ